MPIFRFKAAGADGRTLEGTEEAASRSALERLLTQRGLFALAIAPESSLPDKSRHRYRGYTSRRADVAEATANLASLLEAGLPLSRALEVTARGALRPDVESAFDDSLLRVREGGRLSDAWAAHPGLFPPISIGLVRAADRGGHLTAVMSRLAKHLDREQKLRARVFSALMYPLFLVGAGGAAIMALLLYVLPKFVALLDEAGTAMPVSTALLLALTAFIGRAWPILVAALSCLFVAVHRWRRTEHGRLAIDRIALRLPIIGGLRARQSTIRVSRTLETLLAGGLPLSPALVIAADAAGDSAVRMETHAAEAAVRRGETFAEAVRRASVFPAVLPRLIEVGEETGQLERMLGRAASLMEEELERRLERLVTLIEPILIILFALVIGFVALSLLQAIYGVNADAF